MTETANKTPWHIWVVGIVSLLWNAGGAFDYLMTKLQVESYMSNFTEEQLAYFYSFPAWASATWALAVWSAVLGSVLILLRNKLAVPVFWVGLITMVLTALYSYVISDVNMAELVGPGTMYFSLAIFVIAALLLYYSIAQRRSGNLR